MLPSSAWPTGGVGFVLSGFLFYCCIATAMGVHDVMLPKANTAMNEKNTRSECEQMQTKSLLMMLTPACDRHAQLQDMSEATWVCNITPHIWLKHN